MKLNEKGFNKIVNNLLHLRKLEFESDDFKDGCCQNGKGHVTLTVDEAKALLRRIPEFKENGDWQLPIERLKERIFKAEGKE